MSTEQAEEQGHISIRPDLAVEVLSPNDLAYEVDAKVKEFLAAGVPLVWVVNPDTREIVVHRQDESLGKFREQDEIGGEDVLPEYRCPVAEFFKLPAAAPSATTRQS
jgi:Uma2 family endonuclease